MQFTNFYKLETNSVSLSTTPTPTIIFYNLLDNQKFLFFGVG